MELRIEPEQAGERLDTLLAAPLGSRSRAQRLIAAGCVTVDGRPAPKRHRVQPGEVVAVDEGRDPQPAGAASDTAPFIVAFEDDHLLVVDKPAGVVVHPARGHATGTLVQALSGRVAGGEDPDRPGIVHRLDRDTSGLLLVARDAATHRALKRQLQRREITREYLALVEGRPPARTGTIDAPIGRDRRDRMRMSTDTDNPRAAVTHFTIERALPQTTLLRVRLETGRTHQIRVHLAAIGHPVVGDPVYGTAGALGLERQFLHAARLVFRHPMDGRTVEVVSELPADLREALGRAGA